LSELIFNLQDQLAPFIEKTEDYLKHITNYTYKLTEQNFYEISKDITTDLQKTFTYLKTLIEYDVFLKLRKEKVKNEKGDALIEAERAGALLALEELPKKISCIDPRIRSEVFSGLNNVIGYGSGLNFTPGKIAEMLNRIPDCFPLKSETETTVAIKPKFFAWLVEPFKLNLAAVGNQAQSVNIPPIVIRSQMEHSVVSTMADIVKEGFAFEVIRIINTAREQRESQIGEAWPIETCEEFEIDPGIDEGKAFCKRYLVLTAVSTSTEQEIMARHPGYQSETFFPLGNLDPLTLARIRKALGED